jgi:outer membrane protein
MKKYIRLVLDVCLVTSVVVLLVLQYKNTQERMVYVDSARLFTEYKGLEDARTAYEAKTGEWQRNIDTLTAELQQSVQQYEKEYPGMSNKERSQALELVKIKQKQLADYKLAIEEKAGEEDYTITQDVVKKMNTKISEYGEAHNYKIIFSANQSSNIVYAQDGLDITDAILELLNKDYNSTNKK